MCQKEIRFLKVFIVVFLLVLTTGISQTRTGNIYGTIMDSARAPLPGVSVILTSDLIGQLTFISTEKGNFRFLSLSPGIYALRAELQGFSTVIREKINVNTGVNVTVEIQMEPESIDEAITVTAPSPIVDTKKTTRALNLNVEDLQNVPTARDPWVLLELAPGVVMDRANIGGSESGHQSRFLARGTTKDGANYYFDGIETTDQAAEGSSTMYYDFDAFEEIQIQTAAADVSAFTAGPQINMVTKRGGNRFSGSARFYYSGDAFQSENVPEGLEEGSKVNRAMDYGLNLGGPIVKDKLWFWAGYGKQDFKIDEMVGGAEMSILKTWQWELKLNAQLGAHRLEAMFNYNGNPHYGRVASNPLSGWETRYDQKGPTPIYKLQDEITFSDNLFISVKGSYAGFGFDLIPFGGIGDDKASIYDRATGTYWNTYRYGTLYRRAQWYGQASGYLFSEKLFGISHEFKFGVEHKSAEVNQFRTFAQRLQYNDYSTLDAYRAYIYRQDNADAKSARIGLFFQDTMSLGRLTMVAALRYDRQYGWINDQTVPGTNVDWAGAYNLPGVSITGKDSNVIWNTFSPRLGLIYDLSGKGMTMLKFNFGLYGDRYESGFLTDLAETGGYYRFSWDDINMDERVQSNEISSPRLYETFFEGDPDVLFDPDMKSAKTLELTLGIDHELFEDVGVGATLIYRKVTDLFWERPMAYDENGNLRAIEVTDWVEGGTIPTEWGGYTWWEWEAGLEDSGLNYTDNAPDFYTRYWGLELSFQKRFSSKSRWLLNGSITLQDWRRFYPTRASYGANTRASSKAPMPTDPTNHEPVDLLGGKLAHYVSGSGSGGKSGMNTRWMAKLATSVEVAYGISLAGSFVAREGYIILNRYEDFDVERQGIEDSPVVFTSEYGKDRLDPFITANLRAEKSFNIKGATLTATVDCFNIFNTNTTIDQIDIVNASNYEAITRYVKPRIFRLGVRIKF